MIRAALALLMMTTSAQAQGIADEALQQFADAQAQLEMAETAEDRLNAFASAITAYDASLGMLRAAARDMAEAETVQAEALAIQQTQISRLLGVLSAANPRSVCPFRSFRARLWPMLNLTRWSAILATALPSSTVPLKKAAGR